MSTHIDLKSDATKKNSDLTQLRVSKSSANGQLKSVPSISHVDEAIRSPSESLDTATRVRMERAIGFNFKNVKVHSGAAANRSARFLGADAYAVGYHIVFRKGKFLPQDRVGQELIDHELAHVAQNSSTYTSNVGIDLEKSPNEQNANDIAKISGEVSDNQNVKIPIVRALPAIRLKPSAEVEEALERVKEASSILHMGPRSPMQLVNAIFDAVQGVDLENPENLDAVLFTIRESLPRS